MRRIGLAVVLTVSLALVPLVEAQQVGRARIDLLERAHQILPGSHAGLDDPAVHPGAS